jgi:hypothetical protein
VVAGSYEGAIDWGKGPLPSASSTAAFVTKLDSSGSAIWSKGFGEGGGVDLKASHVDPAGHVLVTGSFSGPVNFGDGSVSAAGIRDLVVAKLDGNGALLWKKVAGDASVQAGGSLATDVAGHVLLGGEISGSVNFGTGAVASHGKDDALVAKLRP